MMFIFILGSTLLLDIGKAARQDAWIVPLLATIFGCLLYLVYISLYKKYPNMPLTGYIIKIWGKYVGSAISFCYIIYFVYIASRVLRDFEELLISSSYYVTSIITLGICMTFVLIYSIHLGIEAFARVTCLCFVFSRRLHQAGEPSTRISEWMGKHRERVSPSWHYCTFRGIDYLYYDSSLFK